MTIEKKRPEVKKGAMEIGESNLEKEMKKKLSTILILSAVIFLSACEKELSTENSTLIGNELIVGKNCRIAKLVYNDTATGINLGSLAATINILDRVDQINAFDSLAVALTFAADITYSNDTIYLNVDEYFVLDLVNNRIKRLHGLTDPTDILSPQFDADYSYNANHRRRISPAHALWLFEFLCRILHPASFILNSDLHTLVIQRF